MCVVCVCMCYVFVSRYALYLLCTVFGVIVVMCPCFLYVRAMCDVSMFLLRVLLLLLFCVYVYVSG